MRASLNSLSSEMTIFLKHLWFEMTISLKLLKAIHRHKRPQLLSEQCQKCFLQTSVQAVLDIWKPHLCSPAQCAGVQKLAAHSSGRLPKSSWKAKTLIPFPHNLEACLYVWLLYPSKNNFLLSESLADTDQSRSYQHPTKTSARSKINILFKAFRHNCLIQDRIQGTNREKPELLGAWVAPGVQKV